MPAAVLPALHCAMASASGPEVAWLLSFRYSALNASQYWASVNAAMAANGNASDAHTTRQVRVVFMFLSFDEVVSPTSLHHRVRRHGLGQLRWLEARHFEGIGGHPTRLAPACSDGLRLLHRIVGQWGSSGFEDSGSCRSGPTSEHSKIKKWVDR